MGNRESKITRAAHIKRNTAGTSNELSFSVLDAVKNELDQGRTPDARKGPLSKLGAITLFTLPGRRKTVGTPTKEKGLPLSSGGFASVDDGASSGYAPLLPTGAASGGGAAGGMAGGAAGDSSLPGGRDGAGLSVDGSGGVRRGAGVSSESSWVAPEDQIRRKKASRKRRRLVVFALVACVAVAVIGGAGSWFYQGYSTQKSYVDDLRGVLEDVRRLDAELVAFDESVSGVLALADGETVSSDDAAAFASEGDLSAIDDSLARSLEVARACAEDMADSIDKEAANQAVVAVSARRDMISAGSGVLRDAREAAASSLVALDAWSVLLEADSLAREAAALVADTTDDNVRASTDKMSEANTLFERADALFARAGSSYAAADFSAYRTYIAKRIEALGYATASNDAFLVRDKDEASKQNDAYNAADEEAAAMAEEFPETPAFVVSAASKQATDQLRSDYTAARSQAASADVFLRDYLNSFGG